MFKGGCILKILNDKADPRNFVEMGIGKTYGKNELNSEIFKGGYILKILNDKKFIKNKLKVY